MDIESRCYCGKITLKIKLSLPPETYSPRACDCSFCTRHGASYVSDPEGSLRIFYQTEKDLKLYRQDKSDKLAQMVMCSHCGVLMGVIYNESDKIWGAINSRATDHSFGDMVIVSPKKLSGPEKIQRWKQVWFKDVELRPL